MYVFIYTYIYKYITFLLNFLVTRDIYLFEPKLKLLKCNLKLF